MALFLAGDSFIYLISGYFGLQVKLFLYATRGTPSAAPAQSCPEPQRSNPQERAYAWGPGTSRDSLLFPAPQSSWMLETAGTSSLPDIRRKLWVLTTPSLTGQKVTLNIVQAVLFQLLRESHRRKRMNVLLLSSECPE